MSDMPTLPDFSDEGRAFLQTILTREHRAALDRDWELTGRAGQIAPAGTWSSWLLMAGRGYGKTRSGAEWVRSLAEGDPATRIALVASSLGEARAIMVEGDSGLLAVATPKHRPTFEPSRRLLRWPGGAQAYLYSAAEPESLRGPQHSHAWCDELAKWDDAGNRAAMAWDNLQLGLRLGHDPRTIVTTTPRAVALVRRLVADDTVCVTRGRTDDNDADLSPRFIAAMRRQYAGSTLGRQELDGELLDDVEGALWSRASLDRCRDGAAATPALHQFARIVIGVDPPVTAHGDACGIVVAGVNAAGTAYVLADCSVEKASPERWAHAVADAHAAWQSDRIVAESNQGGALVATVLRAANVALPVRLVTASRGKSARAEPVAALYEAGRVRHAARFDRLEDEMCGLMAGGGYEGPGRSPDRADALVWALTELMLAQRREPRVRTL